MSKSLFKELCSALAHNQYLFHTLVDRLIRSKKMSENKSVENFKDAIEPYHKTYENIRLEKEQS